MFRSTIPNALLVSVFAISIFSCSPEKKVLNLPETDLSKAAMIPMPLKVVPTHSAFALDQYTAIYTTPSQTDMEAVGTFLSEKINAKTGLRLTVNDTEGSVVDRVIFINQSDSIAQRGDEAYELYITKDSVILSAANSEAAFRGIQTLRQLIPEQANDSLNEQAIWPVPTGKVYDSPNFGFRGAMLDVARHFFSVEDVKKYIELLAYYKINVLHLHLTDDQGWRIEIKSWPKLTTVGGSTEVGGESGGYYTQEEYAEIVAFAEKHHMMVIPEVDMPGHTNAASVSYPFLNGNGKTPKLYEGTHVGFSTFDTRKDTVYSFIDDVVREISALTPGPYFHIGGDESHVTKKNDYRYFVERVEKIVNAHGKRMIGWDEVANANIGSSSVSQFWHSEENAKTAVEKGMQVILSPAKKAYLDMQYDTFSKHGLHWAAYIPVDTAYVWTPETYSGIPKEHILGVEAPLWSETISTVSELEYLAFPRVIGYSELSWSIEANRDWTDYKDRLARQAPFLERMDVNYYPSKLIDWQKETSPELKDGNGM
ncbi:family 20 glycosylhydrolase [Flagellimonas sp. DF-77]|uniref:family 20 glycosylhydrolase n=1 Tax=Flagellimonas algarum TaxID=3230298 RepID=UPI0033997825